MPATRRRALLCGASRLGVVAVLIGYLGVRDQGDLVLQLPYVVSGGLGGLDLMAWTPLP